MAKDIKIKNHYFKFAVFIITHNRPDKQYTRQALLDCNYSGPIYYILDDGDTSRNEYEKLYGKEFVKVFNKKEQKFDIGDNFVGYDKFPIFARNACWQIAKDLGLTHYVQLDDDYLRIDSRLIVGDKLLTFPIKDIDSIFLSMCEFLECSDSIECVAFAVQGDYIGGKGNSRVKDGFYRNTRNSFFCKVDKPFDFVGRIGEDVTVPALRNSLGNIHLTITAIRVVMLDKFQNTGGKSWVSKYWSCFYSVMFCPNICRISSFNNNFTRSLSHNNTVKIISSKYKKVGDNCE